MGAYRYIDIIALSNLLIGIKKLSIIIIVSSRNLYSV